MEKTRKMENICYLTDDLPSRFEIMFIKNTTCLAPIISRCQGKTVVQVKVSVDYFKQMMWILSPKFYAKYCFLLSIIAIFNFKARFIGTSLDIVSE